MGTQGGWRWEPLLALRPWKLKYWHSVAVFSVPTSSAFLQVSFWLQCLPSVQCLLPLEKRTDGKHSFTISPPIFWHANLENIFCNHLCYTYLTVEIHWLLCILYLQVWFSIQRKSLKCKTIKGFDAQHKGFKSRLCYSLVVWPWANLWWLNLVFPPLKW